MGNLIKYPLVLLLVYGVTDEAHDRIWKARTMNGNHLGLLD